MVAEDAPQLMAPLVSFLSDFGLLDPYVGIVKGVMLSLCPELTIVDLTHDVRPQAVEQAAFLAQQAWPLFPAETIHLAVVDPGVGTTREPLALRTPTGFFVGPDNGLLSAALPDAMRRQAVSGPRTRAQLPDGFEARRISSVAVVRGELSATFHGRDVFGPAAAWLAAGRPFEDLGPALACMTVLPPFRGERTVDGVAGRIVHIDRFGNLISTIGRGDLPTGAKQVRIGEMDVPIVRTYGDAEGLVALAGSGGYLEIALVGGSAAVQLDAAIGARVVVRAP
ncbi:MAG: SAM hydrolase/SAM-dependent halogenase family protein [Dehalococcoidia bacterium]